MNKTTQMVKTLLEEGFSYNEISNKLNITKATISYHVTKLGMNKPKRKVDLDTLKALYASGLSVASAASKLGINKDVAARALRNNNVLIRANRAPADKMFVEHSKVGRNAVKNRLIKEGIQENKCSECGLEKSWNGKPVVMVLDHINGVNNDNRIENLRFLCPNCNSQTPTFAGRNAKK